MTTGYTRNDFDGNITRAEHAEFTFAKGGVFQGKIDYSTGGKYNPAEATKVQGEFHFGGLAGPPSSEWTRFQTLDQFCYHESYHGGRSNFYYSGKVIGDRMIGTYKMGGRNATGTFEWKIVETIEEYNLTPQEDEAATGCIPLEGNSGSNKTLTMGVVGESVLVSGAGSFIANGTYVHDGMYKGRSMFTNKETGLQIWWNHGHFRMVCRCVVVLLFLCQVLHSVFVLASVILIDSSYFFFPGEYK